jgi:hypothetical protein
VSGPADNLCPYSVSLLELLSNVRVTVAIASLILPARQGEMQPVVARTLHCLSVPEKTWAVT